MGLKTYTLQIKKGSIFGAKFFLQKKEYVQNSQKTWNKSQEFDSKNSPLSAGKFVV
jgi:hypothetical protein